MLFDTGPGFRKSEPRAAWNATAERYAVSLETDGLAGFRGRPEVAQADHRGTAGLAMAARGILTQSDDRVISCLAAIDVPTLVLAGALDAPFLAALDYMAARIPGATKVVIEGAGHAANLDRPEEFNRAVGDFLRTL
jgi:pimeloyl-ACP methyl ester carboxylesterase